MALTAQKQMALDAQRQYSREVKKARYRELLLSAINEGLASFLSERSKELVFLYLRYAFSLEKERICDEPEVFDAGLKSLFGSRASFLEEDILDKLCSKLNLSYFSKDTFSVSLRKVRNSYLRYETA
jgi:hypothetical protein